MGSNRETFIRRELRRLLLVAVVLYLGWCLAVGHNVTMNLMFYGTLEGKLK